MLASGAAKYNQSMQQFWVEWKPCTILAFAADYEGYNGPLHRVLVEPTKDGASELDQLAPLSASSSAITFQPVDSFKNILDGKMSKTPIARRSLDL